MSISDTAQAKRYASIAEVAAAQCQQFTEEARKAPEYTDTAKQYAEDAEVAATAAQASRDQAVQSANGASSSASSAQSSANSASSSAQYAEAATTQAVTSASSAAISAQSASDDAQIASAAVTKTLRVSDLDIGPLPAAATRANKVLSCDADGNFQFTAPASGSAQDVLNQLALSTGAQLVSDGDITVSESLSEKLSGALTFSTGGQLTAAQQLVYYSVNGLYYSWSGSFPKAIPSNSTPASTGGVANGAWVEMGSDKLRQDLLTGGKANLIGFNDVTVQGAITSINSQFSTVIGSQVSTPPAGESYSGYKHWVPIWDYGHQLSQYTIETPTHVNFEYSGDPVNSATGPVFAMGRTDLDQRSANFSQDSYEIRNVMLDGGTAKLVEFQPWTALMSTVEKCRVINPQESVQWVVNFKAQNWWPHVLNNTYMEYNDKANCFVKAIDDGGNPVDRYTGNSRLLISQNRCAWQGQAAGAGVMSYTSGVAVQIKDNSAQNAKTCVVLGYPSIFSTVDGLYAEMNFGNQQVVQVGDFDNNAPSGVMSEILIKNVYANLHFLNSNRIIIPGNSAVVMNYLEIDRLFISQIPTSGFKQPIVTVNDLAFQKIVAGMISADSLPLINLTNNYVAVIDKYNQNISALNGDLILADASVNVPANAMTQVSKGWYVSSTTSSTFIKSGNVTPNASLRMSRYIGAISSPVGTQTSVVFEHARADLVQGEVVTIQFLINADNEQAFDISVSVFNDNGQRSVLSSFSFTGGGSWKEVTKTVSVSGVSSSNSFIAVMVKSGAATGGNVYITGHRMNRGAFGLCSSSNTYSYAESQRMINDYNYIIP